MDSSIPDPAELAECIAPLNDEERRALRQYWERVIREEWISASRIPPRTVPEPDLEERRARRAARRSMAAVVRALPTGRHGLAPDGREVA